MDDHIKKIDVNQNSKFPTAAIIVIAVGGYILVFAIIMMIRKICISNDKDFCPSWCGEVCLCTSCCGAPLPCTTCLTETCNCTYPNKRCFMDRVCPTKAWCDNVFCCCLSQEAEGRCLCWDTDDCCNCCDCEDTCECNCCKSCKEYFEDCKCQCCAQPETCDCCCIEIKLAGSSQRARAASMNNGGYTNDGYAMNQGIVMQQPPYNQPGFNPQLGYSQPGYSQQPISHQQPDYNPSASYGNQQQMPSGRYNQQPGFRPGGSLTQPQQNMFASQAGPSVSYPMEQVRRQWSRPETSTNVGT